jgi:hypothetical protein
MWWTPAVIDFLVGPAPVMAVQDTRGQISQPPPLAGDSDQMEGELTGLAPAIYYPIYSTPPDLFGMSALLAALPDIPVYLPVQMDVDNGGLENEKNSGKAPAVGMAQHVAPLNPGSGPHMRAAQEFIPPQTVGQQPSTAAIGMTAPPSTSFPPILPHPKLPEPPLPGLPVGSGPSAHGLRVVSNSAALPSATNPKPAPNAAASSATTPYIVPSHLVNGDGWD